jgi:hypothetical protein
MHLTIVDAARDDTCGYPLDQVMLATNALRSDEYDRCGKEALKIIILQDNGDRRPFCAKHVANAARVLRRVAVS